MIIPVETKNKRSPWPARGDRYKTVCLAGEHKDICETKPKAHSNQGDPHDWKYGKESATGVLGKCLRGR